MTDEIKRKIHNDVRRINQSKIKRLSRTLVCAKRYFMEEISGELKRKATEAMVKGQYFEYKNWGTPPKEGGIPEIPLLKRGGKSTDHKRIDEWVAKFDGIMKRHGIKVIKTDFKIEVKLDSDTVAFGTLDALVEYKGLPYIMDLKLTVNVTSTFGDFAWGNFTTLQDPNIPNLYTDKQDDNGGKEMDLIQAHAYMHDIELLTKRKWGFLYAVFDYKKNPEYKIIEVKFSQTERDKLIERTNETKYKLNLFKRLNYEAMPSEMECKACKALECNSRYVQDVDHSETTETNNIL